MMQVVTTVQFGVHVLRSAPREGAIISAANGYLLNPSRRRLPLVLTSLRVLLAPVVVLLAVFHPSHVAFGACFVVALASDVFDVSWCGAWTGAPTFVHACRRRTVRVS